MKFYYVYILKLCNGNFYIGSSENLQRRIEEHLSGQERTTKKFLPLSLRTYIAFLNKQSALKFEKYLKTGSGFAFRNKHLL